MVGPLPLPFRSLVPLIRCLPMGRYRAAYALCRVLPPRFVTRLPRKLGGLAFVCETADVVSRTAFAGTWEPTQTLLISKILQPGMTFVDVGAQWGYFTLVAAARVGPYGSVLSLEPHARLFGVLRDNVDLNRARQVTPLPVAAGATTGYQELVAYDEAPATLAARGCGRARPVRPRCRRRRASGSSRSARSTIWPGSTRWTSIDLVKIDVEGAEGAVVHGMRDLLSHARVQRLLIEVHGEFLERVRQLAQDDVRRSALRRLPRSERAGRPPTVRAIAYGRRHTRGLLRPLDPRVPLAVISHQLWLAPGATPDGMLG